MRVLEAAGRKFGFALRLGRDAVELRLLREARPHDARGRARADPQPRRDLPRRRRLPRRARPRLALGPADPDPARVPAVRQPAAGAADAGRHVARSPTASPATSTSGRAREQRGRVLLDRRPHASRAPSRRWRCSRRVFTRRGVDRIMRYAFELASTRPATPRHLGHQVQRHRPSPCPTGTSASRRWRRAIPTSAPTSTISTS